MKFRHRVQNGVRLLVEFFEGNWFDRTNHVQTFGEISLAEAGIAADQAVDSEAYQPASPAHIRNALRDLPIEDLSPFSFVDLGAGKGRSLFVAAGWPFRQIVGVEFSPTLYEQACANLRGFKPRLRRSGNIAVHHLDACHFTFPQGDLVLYLYNPFGASTMQRVLANLDAARRHDPCHVFVILLWPQCSDQVAALEGMNLRRQTRQYQVFEALPLPCPVEEDARWHGESAAPIPLQTDEQQRASLCSG